MCVVITFLCKRTASSGEARSWREEQEAGSTTSDVIATSLCSIPVQVTARKTDGGGYNE